MALLGGSALVSTTSTVHADTANSQNNVTNKVNSANKQSQPKLISHQPIQNNEPHQDNSLTGKADQLHNRILLSNMKNQHKSITNSLNVKPISNYKVNRFDNHRVTSNKSIYTQSDWAKINNIRQKYNYLKKYENSSNINDMQNYRHDVVDWVNFYRGLYNLTLVTEDPSYDSKAQAGANNGNDPEDMIMGDPNSNTGMNPSDVNTYVTDTLDADHNGTPGHRGSVLNPRSSKIGVGAKGGRDTLYFNFGMNNPQVSNNILTFPNKNVFPLSDVNNGKSDYWGYSFIVPNKNTNGYYTNAYNTINVKNPNVIVHDDTNNSNISVTDVHNGNDTDSYSGAIYYKVDTSALKADHQYTITITGQGIPNGKYSYTTKLFNLDSSNNSNNNSDDKPVNPNKVPNTPNNNLPTSSNSMSQLLSNAESRMASIANGANINFSHNNQASVNSYNVAIQSYSNVISTESTAYSTNNSIATSYNINAYNKKNSASSINAEFISANNSGVASSLGTILTNDINSASADALSASNANSLANSNADLLISNLSSANTDYSLMKAVPSSSSSNSNSNPNKPNTPNKPSFPNSNPDNHPSKPSSNNSAKPWIIENNGQVINSDQINWDKTGTYSGMTYRYSTTYQAIEFTGGTCSNSSNNNSYSLFFDPNAGVNSPFSKPDIKSAKFDSDVNTDGITDGQGLFSYPLESLYLPDGFGKNITNARSMFNGIKSTLLVLPNGFGQNITNAQEMFEQTNLHNIVFPAGFGQKITNAQNMFYNNNVLSQLILPAGFGQNIINASGMFGDNHSLGSIVLPNGFGQNIGSNLSDYEGMFSNDSSLQNLVLQEPSVYSNGLNTELHSSDLDNSGKWYKENNNGTTSMNPVQLGKDITPGVYALNRNANPNTPNSNPSNTPGANKPNPKPNPNNKPSSNSSNNNVPPSSSNNSDSDTSSGSDNSDSDSNSDSDTPGNGNGRHGQTAPSSTNNYSSSHNNSKNNNSNNLPKTGESQNSKAIEAALMAVNADIGILGFALGEYKRRHNN